MTPEQAERMIRVLEENARKADAITALVNGITQRLDERLSQLHQVLIEIRESIPEGESGPGGVE